MNNRKQNENMDMVFYKNEVAPILPEEILDFHVHVWIKDNFKFLPWEKNDAGNYLVTTVNYSIEDLIKDGKIFFPDRPLKTVCFGIPTPSGNLKKTNEYTATGANIPGFFPLFITGRNTHPVEEIEQAILNGPFLGFKVFLNYIGNDYGDLQIDDMIGPKEMNLAEKYHLVVLLHVPRVERLADPVVQSGVQCLAKTYPNANIVLAHCGRCYIPDQMKRAINSVKNLENVYFDTAMVMDPTVLQIILESVEFSRVLFASDLPVARMMGRRVYVMDHWVDIVLEKYPKSLYRVQSNDIRATYMVYEIILAIKRAAERVNINKEALKSIFYNNGKKLLDKAAKAIGKLI